MRIIKIIILIAFLFVTDLSYAVTKDQLLHIYYKIIVSNQIKYAPPLIVEPYDNVDARFVVTNTGYKFIQVHPKYMQQMSKLHAAMTLSHELGHFLHKDVGGNWSNSESIKHEYAADKKGKQLALKAGYNVCKSAKVFLSYPYTPDHPQPVARYNAYRCK